MNAKAPQPPPPNDMVAKTAELREEVKRLQSAVWELEALTSETESERNQFLRERDKALDAVEFAEGALLDHYGSEEGLDVITAGELAMMCSAILVKCGRTSVIVEREKQPET